MFLKPTFFQDAGCKLCIEGGVVTLLVEECPEDLIGGVVITVGGGCAVDVGWRR